MWYTNEKQTANRRPKLEKNLKKIIKIIIKKQKTNFPIRPGSGSRFRDCPVIGQFQRFCWHHASQANCNHFFHFHHNYRHRHGTDSLLQQEGALPLVGSNLFMKKALKATELIVAPLVNSQNPLLWVGGVCAVSPTLPAPLGSKLVFIDSVRIKRT